MAMDTVRLGPWDETGSMAETLDILEGVGWGRLKARLMGWARSRDKPGETHTHRGHLLSGSSGYAKEEGMGCENYLDNTQFLRKYKETLGRGKVITGCIVLGITTLEKNPSD